MAGESSPLLRSCMPSSDGSGSTNGNGNGNGNDNAKKEPEWSLEDTEKLSAFAEQNPSIFSAAYLLRDAIILAKSNSSFAHTDYLISSYDNSVNRSSEYNTYRKILVNPFIKGLTKLCVFGLVLLSFIEPPNWCRGFSDGDSDGLNGCEDALAMKGTPLFYTDDTETREQYYYPSSGAMALTVYQSLYIERALVGFLLLHLILCLAKDGFSIERYFCLNLSRMHEVDAVAKKRIRTVAAFRYVRLFALFFIMMGMVNFSPDNPQRIYSHLWRIILFISFSEGIQNELMVLVKILPAILSVGFVLTLVIGFYGLIGIAAFYNTKEGVQHFDNYVDGVWTLFTSMTTVIYPDVMMAGYNDNRFVAIYFITYMMLTFFFFQNVILGIITNEYTSSHELREDELETSRMQYIKQAFNLLTNDMETDAVTRDQLMAIFLILNTDCYEIQAIPHNEALLLFAVLDTDGSEMLEFEEFCEFGNVMLLEFIGYEKFQSTFERIFPSVLESTFYTKLRKVILLSWFDYSIDVMVFINAVIVIAQMYPMLAGTEVVSKDDAYDLMRDGRIDTKWEVAETFFTVLFVIEMTLKITVLGWNRYTLSMRNCFDGLVTFLSAAATFYVYYPNSYSNSELIRFILVARSLRVLRLCLVIDHFKSMSHAVLGIMPAAGRVVLALFCVVFLWSWIGMFWFGGKITRDPNNPLAARLEGTDFAGSFYWANNFNDMLSGLNVCYNLLVINNWNVLESGIMAICDTKYYRFYFLSFYIVGVMIVNNLVVALIIDYFLDEYGTDEEEEKAALEAEANLVFDSDDMPTPKKFGKYVARLNPEFRRTHRSKKKVLQKLFAARVLRN